MLPALARRIRPVLTPTFTRAFASARRPEPRARRAPRLPDRIMRTLGVARDRGTLADPDGFPTSAGVATAPREGAPRDAATRDTRAVIVLGGGSDIGVAIAGELVAHGAEAVVLAGRDREQMRERALEAGIGVRLETVEFDARRIDLHVGAIEEAFTLAGDVQAVVLAFGVLGDNDAFEASPALAGGAAATNFAGAVSASLAAVRALARQSRPGTLIVLSSVAAVKPRSANYVYGATKAGLDFFARGLARSVRPRGVRVLIVRPGFVATKMTRGRRRRPFATTPARLAADVREAIEADRTICWSPGLLRWVSVPLRLVPEALVWRLRL